MVVPVDWSTCQCVLPAHWWRLLFICESLLVDWARGRGKRKEGRIGKREEGGGKYLGQIDEHNV